MGYGIQRNRSHKTHTGRGPAKRPDPANRRRSMTSSSSCLPSALPESSRTTPSVPLGTRTRTAAARVTSEASPGLVEDRATSSTMRPLSTSRSRRRESPRDPLSRPTVSLAACAAALLALDGGLSRTPPASLLFASRRYGATPAEPARQAPPQTRFHEGGALSAATKRPQQTSPLARIRQRQAALLSRVREHPHRCDRSLGLRGQHGRRDR
jgi:hypothetical protein